MQKLYKHKIDDSIIATYHLCQQREYIDAMRTAIANMYEFVNACHHSRKVTNISLICNYLMKEEYYA